MGHYNRNQLMNSKLAFKVLKKLNKKENYGTQIAEDMDIEQSSVNRVLVGLFEEGLIETSKRERAKYYQINSKGLYKFWIGEIKRRLEEKGMNPNKEGSNFQRYKSQEEVRVIFNTIVSSYLSKVDESTLETLFLDDMTSILNLLSFELGGPGSLLSSEAKKVIKDLSYDLNCIKTSNLKFSEYIRNKLQKTIVLPFILKDKGIIPEGMDEVEAMKKIQERVNLEQYQDIDDSIEDIIEEYKESKED